LGRVFVWVDAITVVQFLFTILTCLLHKKCHRLKARVVIYAYQVHVRFLSPEPLVVKQPKSTRVEEPTLLCNHLGTETEASVLFTPQVLTRLCIIP
jgi:hypothetical protein